MLFNIIWLTKLDSLTRHLIHINQDDHDEHNNNYNNDFIQTNSIKSSKSQSQQYSSSSSSSLSDSSILIKEFTKMTHLNSQHQIKKKKDKDKKFLN
ncbi:unnamed protein product, partial [Rotaria sordida]